MKYNLTENQKDLARRIAQEVRGAVFGETLYFAWGFEDVKPDARVILPNGISMSWPVELGALAALHAESLVRLAAEPNCPTPHGVVLSSGWERGAVRCTVTAKLQKAVETNFSEEDPPPLISTLAQPHPPEIALSIDRLRAKYPDAKKLGFLVMRFAAAKPFQCIVEAIKNTGEKHSLSIIRVIRG
jgi:hypothetical protein